MEMKRDSFFLSDKKHKKEYKPGEAKRRFNSDGKQHFKDKRPNEFNKNRNGVEKEEKTEKKPFDKKTYRMKKYSKKYKLEQWEDQRKKRLLRDYYKDVKKDPMIGSYKPMNFDEDTIDSKQEVGKFVRHPDLMEQASSEKKEEKRNKDPYFKAKEKLNQLKQEKLQKKQEMERVKQEKQLKLQEYKKKKQERFKKLSKKTKKGQPVMTGRLELLLEKLQASK